MSAPGAGAADASNEGSRAPEIVGTPTAWRVAAAGVLTGGFLAGIAATRGRAARVLPFAAVGVALGSAVPVALASRRPPITPEAASEALDRADPKPSFSVVVGARDEAVAIPRLIADLAAQDYRDAEGAPRFEVVVVDDRSTDGTGDAARRAAREHGLADAVRVVERRGTGLADGKGAALTAAQPETCRGDLVVVLDADARLEPHFLRTAAGYFAAGAAGVTGRRRILDAGRGWLERVQADEQTLDGEINRGRWALGGCSEFRGNGIMVRRDLLAEVGGWRASALTEDTDLSSRVAARTGSGVAWAIDAEVWEEPVVRPAALWSQRKRWAEGALRRFLEHGPALLRSPRVSPAAKLDFAVYGAQLAVPPFALGVIAGTAARGRKRRLLVLAAGYFGASAILAWDALRWDEGATPEAGERLRRTVGVSLFNGIWLAAVPRALLNIALSRGPVRYVKMVHEGSGEPGRK
jgi:1,2-diacylglycerol 3-beta-glucosyltransferase